MPFWQNVRRISSLNRLWSGALDPFLQACNIFIIPQRCIDTLVDSMVLANAHVPEPELSMRDGTPVSQAFEDVYFSRDGGIAETEHVFIKSNGLPERWQGKPRFTIAELGFGTGLSFLVALKHFRATAPAGAVLHYMGFERYPFKPEVLRELLALQPELASEAAELLAAYPLRLPGLQRIHLPQVVLTLAIGEVAELLPQMNMQVDAWFLDGFAPAKNPAMWSEEILAQVGRLSAPDATFATFTAAGAVKRGLQAAGFIVEKIPGFGHKREMLVGRLEESSSVKQSSQKNIIVIGAGIAGATLAHALAMRGYQVTVLERGEVANGASGNVAGVLFPQLTKQWNTSTAWYFTAYGFMLRQLARWRAAGLEFKSAAPGMLRLPRHAEEEQQLRALNETLGLDAAMVQWMERDAASAQAGLELQTGGAYFPHGTWVNAPSLCAALLQHGNIMLRSNSCVTKLAREGDGWQVTLADGEVLSADTIGVAAAEESVVLLGDYAVKLNAVGGQLTEISTSDAAQPLRSILCHKGYVVPLANSYLIGATYHREEMHAVTDARHAENIVELANVLPGWFNGKAIGGRSSLRATTPDRMPYIGALDDGLYVSTGHGSRGLLSAPLAGEMIASAISGEQSPVSVALAAAVHPLRFK